MITTTCTSCGAVRPSFEAVCPQCLAGSAVEDRVDDAAAAADAPPADVPGLIDWNAERKKRGKAPVMVEPLPGASLQPSTDTPSFARPCDHQQVIVDGKEREVTCSACEAVLDPVWVLLRYALKERDFVRHREYALTEQRKLREEIEFLKKERQKVRNGINRDPLVKRIHELEKQLSAATVAVYEFRECYQSAKAKLEGQGKKPPRKPRPQLVGGIGDA